MKFSRFFPLLLLFVSLAAACDQDPCKDMICGAQGECKEGVCKCDPGYVEDDFGRCEVSIAAMIAGNYQASTAGCNINDYVLTIQENPAIAGGLFLVNIGTYTCLSTGGGELTVRANFTSDDQFELDASEQYCNQYSIIGSGTIAADSSITIIYRAEYEIGGGSQIIENCTVTLTK